MTITGPIRGDTNTVAMDPCKVFCHGRVCMCHSHPISIFVMAVAIVMRALEAKCIVIFVHGHSRNLGLLEQT